MFERAKRGYKPPKPQKSRINFFMDKTIYDQLEAFCEKNDYKRNELIECILEEFLNKYGKKK
jgi:metal-responsive CopG/Arc/MetJ family transcriptional regulator